MGMSPTTRKNRKAQDMDIDTEPTAKVIDDMSRKMLDYSKQLDNLAEKMRLTGDITYASEALGVATNAMSNLRLDLLITRPLKETMKNE